MSESDDRPQRGWWEQWSIADLVEITVVPERRHRVAHRGVDGSVRPFRHGDRDLERLEEEA